MHAFRGLRSSILSLVILAMTVPAAGCQTTETHCGQPGSGDECERATDVPERHTRTPDQPVRADEYHDQAITWPTVSAEVIRLTNTERTERGQTELQEDTTLSQIACWHNQDMLTHAYHGHEDSDDRRPSDRVAREHRRLIGAVGENVLRTGALNPDATRNGKMQWAERLMRLWMDSPGHRSNILHSDWTHLGACVSQDSSKSRGTQVFAQTWAYLEEPLPWTMAPGDSTTVSFQLVKAPGPPRRYEWAPADEPLGKAFEDGTGQPIKEKLYLPTSTGTYALRLLVPDGRGRYTILGGPRVWVKPEEEPAY